MLNVVDLGDIAEQRRLKEAAGLIEQRIHAEKIADKADRVTALVLFKMDLLAHSQKYSDYYMRQLNSA